MPKVNAIRPAVSIKKPSGTILISISVDGSRIHRSLLKKIWWNIIKYFVKSVEMMAARAAIRPKNSPVPRQTEGGKKAFHISFVTAIKTRAEAHRTRHTLRMEMAARNSP